MEREEQGVSWCLYSVRLREGTWLRISVESGSEELYGDTSPRTRPLRECGGVRRGRQALTCSSLGVVKEGFEVGGAGGRVEEGGTSSTIADIVRVLGLVNVYWAGRGSEAKGRERGVIAVGG